MPSPTLSITSDPVLGADAFFFGPFALNPFTIRPGCNLGANLKPISHRCYLFEVAFVWELTRETIVLPLGCLQGGLGKRLSLQGSRYKERTHPTALRDVLGRQAAGTPDTRMPLTV